MLYEVREAGYFLKNLTVSKPDRSVLTDRFGAAAFMPVAIAKIRNVDV